MTDLSVVRERKDIPLSGAGNPTVNTVGVVGQRYQRTTAPYEMFTLTERVVLAWGTFSKWVGTQGTIVDPDILNPANANLAAMYTMDNISGATLVDESPNNIDGTIRPGVTAVAGKIDNALNFPGTLIGSVAQEYVVLETSNGPLSEVVKRGDHCICCWVRLDSVPDPGNGSVIFGSREDGAGTPSLISTKGFEFLNVLSDGSVLWRRGSNDNKIQSISAPSTVSIGTSTWHFLRVNVTYTNDTNSSAEVFVDEVSVGSISGSHADIDGLGNPFYSTLAALRWADGTSLYLGPADGLLDHARVYDRILTTAEGTALHNEGLGI